MGPFGGYSEAIPSGKPSRMESHSEWKAIPKGKNPIANVGWLVEWLDSRRAGGLAGWLAGWLDSLLVPLSMPLRSCLQKLLISPL